MNENRALTNWRLAFSRYSRRDSRSINCTARRDNKSPSAHLPESPRQAFSRTLGPIRPLCVVREIVIRVGGVRGALRIQHLQIVVLLQRSKIPIERRLCVGALSKKKCKRKSETATATSTRNAQNPQNVDWHCDRAHGNVERANAPDFAKRLFQHHFDVSILHLRWSSSQSNQSKQMETACWLRWHPSISSSHSMAVRFVYFYCYFIKSLYTARYSSHRMRGAQHSCRALGRLQRARCHMQINYTTANKLSDHEKATIEKDKWLLSADCAAPYWTFEKIEFFVDWNIEVTWAICRSLAQARSSSEAAVPQCHRQCN